MAEGAALSQSYEKRLPSGEHSLMFVQVFLRTSKPSRFRCCSTYCVVLWLGKVRSSGEGGNAAVARPIYSREKTQSQPSHFNNFTSRANHHHKYPTPLPSRSHSCHSLHVPFRTQSIIADTATMLLYYSLATFLSVASLSNAQTWPQNLIGTWSTKSNKTLTGPVCHSRSRGASGVF